MERVKVRIVGDADSGYVFVPIVPTKPQRTAIYIGPEKSIWLLDQERALEMIREYGEQCMSSFIGKTDYIIIYPAESAVEIDGEDYLMGECLIMKSENGVKCMNEEELAKAFNEYASRMSIVYAGQYGLPAYQMN